MKIICIGHNYMAHIIELGSPIPENPVFFLKPDTALLRDNSPFYVPEFSNDLHYELEVVYKINRVTKSIEERFAHRCYDQVGVGIDFTARDIQKKCVEKGLPWEICKAFDNSAAVSTEMIDINTIENPKNINFRLELNGKTVQNGSTNDMIFDIDKIISYVSQFITLRVGDLIFTGTPVGVGSVKSGDHLCGYLNDKLLLDFDIK